MSQLQITCHDLQFSQITDTILISYIPVKDVPKFKGVAANWLEYKKANVRSSTFNMYRGHYVGEHFNSWEMRLNIIKSMLNQALRDDAPKYIKIDANPLMGQRSY